MLLVTDDLKELRSGIKDAMGSSFWFMNDDMLTCLELVGLEYKNKVLYLKLGNYDEDKLSHTVIWNKCFTTRAELLDFLEDEYETKHQNKKASDAKTKS